MGVILSTIIKSVTGYLVAFFFGRQSKDKEILEDKLDAKEDELKKLRSRPRLRPDFDRVLRKWIQHIDEE